MPPWHGFLNPKLGTFVNDQSLNADEREAILSWCQNGAPRGNATDAPAPSNGRPPSLGRSANPITSIKWISLFASLNLELLNTNFFE